MFLSIDWLGLHIQDLTWYQMMIRSTIVFVLAMVFIRIAGMRTFGTRSPFDVVVSITLGGMLAKTIMGHYPFFPSLLACATVAALHRLISFLAARNKGFNRFAMGDPIYLFQHGHMIYDAMKNYNISDKDLVMAIHEQNMENFDNVLAIRLEPDGKISVTKKS